ncbi:MAG TPA: enterochelin esterase [Acidobacteriaceae bacterium]|nr:enterochelin esterase [Acidobacteriaceae bacterium]
MKTRSAIHQIGAFRRFSVVFCALSATFLAGLAIAQQTTSSTAGSDASAAIVRLKRELPAAHSVAVRKFWTEVARTGAPLIEPVPGDKDYSFVTFLWRGADDTRNVVIFDGVAAFDAKDRMQRVANTDVWYKTYRVRNDARFAYNLSPNDSLEPFDHVKGDDKMKQRLAFFRPDPLNPRHCPTTFGAYGADSSYVELPNAGPLLWESNTAGIPQGNLTETRIHSELLHRDKKLWVYTPAGFHNGHEQYPLLVLFDGDRNSMWMPKVLDLMIARRQIPPMVAVMTDESTPSIRNSELPCNPEFADFLASELVPWARNRYSVTSSPQRTIVAGSSYGGLASVFAGLRHPEVFGNVISLSGSFWWKPEGNAQSEWLVHQAAISPKRPLRFYLEVGLMEVGASVDQVGANRRMHQALNATGYPTGYAEYDGGHSFLNWSEGMVHGLKYLMR